MDSLPSASTQIRVRVLFFSVLREKVGTSEKTVSLKAPARGTDVLGALIGEYPEIGEHRDTIRLAVNEEYVSEDVSLEDGDEVALITPVSGG